jgi:hydrogenase/urease accessory protein HupE
MRSLGIALTLLCVALMHDARAHEVRPGFLELREATPNVFLMTWKVPARGALHLAIRPVLPESCQHVGEGLSVETAGAFVEHSRIRCDHGLAGERLAIASLASTQTDVLLRLERRDGSVWNTRLTPASPEIVIPAGAGPLDVIRAYVGLGINHILLGLDHLLFIFCLVLLVREPRKLLWTITAFTLAHSITLTAATLGLVRVPSAPVEASIALSILFLARELLVKEGGARGLTQSYPWLIAFGFGLLHGLGFASALAEIGLPQGEIPLALFSFNVGVELGQLAFIAALLGAWAIACRLARAAPGWTPVWAPRLAGYAVGTTASFWFFARLAAV